MSSSREVPLFNTENDSEYMVQSTPPPVAAVSQENPLPSTGSIHIRDSIDINSGGGALALPEEINQVRARKRSGVARGSNPKPSRKKRGGGESVGYDHHHYNTTTKKPRLIWTTELHQNFLEAHDSYIEKPVPKLILEYMRRSGFPYISRENVASHLQKHRLYLKKQQDKELGYSSTESNFKPYSLPSPPRTYHNNSKLRSSSSSKSEPITCPRAHDLSKIRRTSSSSNSKPITCPRAHDLPDLPPVIHSQQPITCPRTHDLPLIHSQHTHDLPLIHSQHQTWENQPMDNVQLLEFDQTYLFDQNMVPPEPTMLYPQTLQPQLIGQPSLNGALDFAIMINLLGEHNLSNQFSNINANDHFHTPNNYVPTLDDLSNNYFPHDCTMNLENLQIDCESNMYGLGAQSYSDALEFGHPIKQDEFGQVVQTMPYDDASMLPQASDPWEEQGKHLKREGEGEGEGSN